MRVSLDPHLVAIALAREGRYVTIAKASSLLGVTPPDRWQGASLAGATGPGEAVFEEHLHDTGSACSQPLTTLWQYNPGHTLSRPPIPVF